tara:strand:+ start:136 stop:294 length:159 start_codon:yes stop_codon:yes gene_type:complete
MNKSWYQSKTVWSGLVIAVVGIVQALGYNIPTELVYSLAGAFGLYGIRDAIK